MEHGLKYITFYIQNILLAVCYNLSLVPDKPLGAPVFVKLVYWIKGNVVNGLL